MAASWKKFLLDDDILQVRKNTGSYLTARPKLNFIEGDNISLTVADDATEIDITVNATGLLPLAGGTMTGALVAAAHGTATDHQVVNIIYGTGNPPNPGSYPEGTLYIKYVA